MAIKTGMRNWKDLGGLLGPVIVCVCIYTYVDQIIVNVLLLQYAVHQVQQHMSKSSVSFLFHPFLERWFFLFGLP